MTTKQSRTSNKNDNDDDARFSLSPSTAKSICRQASKGEDSRQQLSTSRRPILSVKDIDLKQPIPSGDEEEPTTIDCNSSSSSARVFPLQEVEISRQRTPRKTTHKSKKKVRFQGTTNAEAETLESCSPPSNNDTILTEELSQQLWYTSRECHDMELRADESACYFLATNGRYHAAVEQLLTACIANSKNLAWQVRQMEKPNIYNYNLMDSDDNDEALSLVVQPNVRGLVFHTVDMLNLESCQWLQRQRDRHVARVLNVQSTWRRNDLHLTNDQKATLLAFQATQSSRVTRQFARLLAQGDARLVHNELQQPPLQVVDPASTTPTRFVLQDDDDDDDCSALSPTSVLSSVQLLSISSDADVSEKLSFPQDFSSSHNNNNVSV